MFYGLECGLFWCLFRGTSEECLFCCWVRLCPYWVFAWWICLFLIQYVEVSNHNSGFIYFSLHFYQFLPQILCHSSVRCTHVKDCYIFLENWSLNHFVVPPLTLKTFFVMKSASSESNVATSIYFWLVLESSIHLIPLICMCPYIDKDFL